MSESDEFSKLSPSLETAQTSFIPVAKIENAELLKNSCMLVI